MLYQEIRPDHRFSVGFLCADTKVTGKQRVYMEHTNTSLAGIDRNRPIIFVE